MSIRVCSQPLLRGPAQLDVMEQPTKSTTKLTVSTTPVHPPLPQPRPAPNPRKDRADCNAVFRLPPVHRSAGFPLPRVKDTQQLPVDNFFFPFPEA